MKDIVFQNQSCKLKKVGPSSDIYLISEGRVDMSSSEHENLGITEEPDLRITQEYLCLDKINIIAVRGYYDDVIFESFVTQVEYSLKQEQMLITNKLGCTVEDFTEALNEYKRLKDQPPSQTPEAHERDYNKDP